MKCLLGVDKCEPVSTYFNDKHYNFFIGYQKSSGFYSEAKILALGDRVSSILNNDFKKYDLRIRNTQWGFKRSIHISCEICKLIQESFFCIFEISDLNPNVMIEIGKSLYKNIIVIRNKYSEKPPTDLGGLLYIEYYDAEHLLKEKSAEIINIIGDKINAHYKTAMLGENFFLKDQIKNISFKGKFTDGIEWEDLTQIIDEEKLNDAHDYTLVGITKYKKIKKEYLSRDISLKDIETIAAYFNKSNNLNNKIIENNYYLYLLDLLKLGVQILKNEQKDFNIQDYKSELDKKYIESYYVNVILEDLSNKNLRNFLFIDSQLLIDRLVNFPMEYNCSSIEVYEVLKFLYKIGIIENFNELLIKLIKNDFQSRHELIGKISKDSSFNVFGIDVIKYIERSNGIDKTKYGSESILIDKDLRDKFSYLLGVFGDIRAEAILISMIDGSSEIIIPAIDALAKINSLKSIPYLIKLYKTIALDYSLKQRVINALKKIKEKNSIEILDIFLDDID